MLSVRSGQRGVCRLSESCLLHLMSGSCSGLSLLHKTVRNEDHVSSSAGNSGPWGGDSHNTQCLLENCIWLQTSAETFQVLVIGEEINVNKSMCLFFLNVKVGGVGGMRL